MRVPAVFQAYENGFMIWRSDLQRIYAFTTGYPQLRRYEDTWTQGEVIDAGEAPDGLYSPVRGFGKIWLADPILQSELGWASSPEQGYTLRTQSSGAYKYASLYMTLPDGAVVAQAGRSETILVADMGAAPDPAKLSTQARDWRPVR